MRRFRLLLTLTVAIVGCVLVFSNHTLPSVATFLNVGQIPSPVDFVVALPGGNNTRTFAASAMYRYGMANEVIVLQNFDSPSVLDGISVPSHVATKEIYDKLGVKEVSIRTLQKKSANTMDDISALQQVFNDTPQATVAIVTDAYHTRRVQWVCQQALTDNMNRISIVAAPTDAFDDSQWWLTADGATAILGEYLKLVYYQAKSIHTRQLAIAITSLFAAAIIAAWRLQRIKTQSTSR